MAARAVFPHAVRDIETLWITLGDGSRLAARLWLPEGAEEAPVPAIVEYIPYRRRDFTRARDEAMHRYFAGHGYAALRIDLRGSGDSDGVLADEYLPIEQDDALAAMAWIAAQPWCDGKVGMIGKSWGGFAALQVAARRPAALKAIVAVCATDDRYGDDAHFMGGALLNENLTWGSALFTFNAYPPDPQVVGGRWRAMWLERLRANQPFPALWLGHQRRDAYWQHGSVAEDFGLIQCPVYAVGGWADAYVNAVPRLLAGLISPRKGLIGPWAHLYPHDGVPGPAIGFLQETLRWWDHWLKGRETGVMAEPMLRVWMQGSVRPADFHDQRPGRWVAERVWPAPRIQDTVFWLADGGLHESAVEGRPALIQSPATTGLAAGAWCGFGVAGDLPGDQRVDDANSLVFEGPPLARPIEILGFATVALDVACDRPHAMLAVRLMDVAPDGASLRVSYGLLNLAHHAGSAAPTPLRPGARYQVCVPLNCVAHGFAAGHRIRIAISTAYWPIAWPSPEPTRVSVHGGRLTLPFRPPAAEDAGLTPFGPAESARAQGIRELRRGVVRRSVERDEATGEVVHVMALGEGDLAHGSLTHIEPIDLAITRASIRRFSIRPNDPLSAVAEARQSFSLARADWRVTVATWLRQTASPDAFRIEARLVARAGDEMVFERDWDGLIPRDNL
jgi:uncharacterized protein